MRKILGLLLILAHAPLALAQGDARYVTDEIQIVLRDTPRAEGAPRGVVNSGARLTVVDANEQSGYVKVRTSASVEGWILSRHLKREPIASDRVKSLDKELASAQAELKKLKDDHAKLLADFARISGGEPIASRELLAEADNLRAQIRQKDQEVEAMRARYDLQRGSQRTLVLGGALVAGGFLLALLMRLLWPRRSRWGGDF